MGNTQGQGRETEPAGEWPLAWVVIASLAVAATLAGALVVYVLAVAEGERSGRFFAVLPIYFIAAFCLGMVIFWGLRAVLRRVKMLLGDPVMGTREYGAVVLLTFVVASALHYTQSQGLRDLREAERSQAASGVTAAELRDADESARLRAAAEQPLQPDAWALLMRDRDAGVRLALAKRADLPAELTELLAADPASEVRAVIGASAKTADATLQRLAYDREASVRLAVAGNPHAASGVLDILAASSAKVRAAVAANPRTSPDTLAKLMNDEDQAVARA